MNNKSVLRRWKDLQAAMRPLYDRLVDNVRVAKKDGAIVCYKKIKDEQCVFKLVPLCEKTSPANENNADRWATPSKEAVLLLLERYGYIAELQDVLLLLRQPRETFTEIVTARGKLISADEVDYNDLERLDSLKQFIHRKNTLSDYRSMNPQAYYVYSLTLSTTKSVSRS